MPAQFNIDAFLRQYHVDVVTHGVNVKAGELNINCPFCHDDGNPDPSAHLGISLEKGSYSCWRNQGQHKGLTWHRLLMRIAGMTWRQAHELLHHERMWVSGDEFELLAEHPERFFGDAPPPAAARPAALAFPAAFQAFRGRPYERPFLEYLIEQRGFYPRDALPLATAFALQFCRRGEWGGRIIVPATLDGELVGWTGRSIKRRERVRYKTLSEREGALLNVKQLVGNYDRLRQERGRWLVVVEGPLDMLKLDYYGRPFGLRASCLYGKSVKDCQIDLIFALSQHFEKVVLLLDAEELGDMLRMDAAMAYFQVPVVVGALPGGVSDPGMLTYRQIKHDMVEQFLCS